MSSARPSVTTLRPRTYTASQPVTWTGAPCSMPPIEKPRTRPTRHSADGRTTRETRWAARMAQRDGGAIMVRPCSPRGAGFRPTVVAGDRDLGRDQTSRFSYARMTSWTRSRFELGEQPADVGLDRGRRHEQLGADLGVARAPRDARSTACSRSVSDASRGYSRSCPGARFCSSKRGSRSARRRRQPRRSRAPRRAAPPLDVLEQEAGRAARRARRRTRRRRRW